MDPIPASPGFLGSLNHPSWDGVTLDSIVASLRESGRRIDRSQSIRTRDEIAIKKTRNPWRLKTESSQACAKNH